MIKLVIQEKPMKPKRALRKRHDDYMLERARNYYKTRKKNEVIE